ncbi:MAG: hypothetical protein GY762_06700 [Proteobacteria bacterium]|nr:hypothetical protein [Pseudomonadota bacterium]
MTASTASRAAENKPVPRYVRPLKVEVGPVLSPCMNPITENSVFGSLGFLWAERERGRATYQTLGSSLVLGGEWRSPKMHALAIGGDLVALQVTKLRTRIPPAIDESLVFFDLGILRLYTKIMAFNKRVGMAKMTITPFFRLGLPTDTSRNNESRHAPIRTVLDDRVALAAYMLIEPGVSMGVLLGPASFYTHQSPIFATVYGEVFHFFWSMYYGIGVNIREILDITLEAAWLARATQDFQEDTLSAFGLNPGVRLNIDPFSYELAFRIGLTEDAHAPYGDVTASFTLTWRP